MIAVRTSKTRDRLSRRSFLARMGVGAAMLPLVHAERVPGAMAAGFPKRLITIAWANGVAQSNFYPDGDDPTEKKILQPLAALRSKVTVIAGLDMKIMLDLGKTYDGHSSHPTLFTGSYGGKKAASGPSVDQIVSDEIAKQVNLPLALLNISVNGASASFRARGTPNTAETDPTRLFANVFAGKSLSTDRLAAVKARRKSILDYVGGELKAFGGRVGTDDRARIDAHLDSIRKLELELDAAMAPSCNATAPASGDYPARMKAFNDLVVMAIRCDVTRAVSMTWAANGGSGPATMPWLGLRKVSVGPSDGASEIHAIAHQGPPGYDQKTVIDTWYITQLAYLAKALDAVPEAGSTALDNSIIVMGNDMAEGSQHSVDAIPFVLVGSAGGAIKAGRTIRVGSWAGKTGNYWRSGKTGVAHNRLLASVAAALDVRLESFGDAKYAGNMNADLLRG